MAAATKETSAADDAPAGLEFPAFRSHFRALTTISQPSRAEEPVIEHVRSWAEQHGPEPTSPG